MTDKFLHDWWHQLTKAEQNAVTREEREVERKKELLREYTDKIELEIAGHKRFRQLLVNRGTQRARGGHKPHSVRWAKHREQRQAT